MYNISRNDLLKIRKNKTINETAEILNVSKSSVERLLKYYKLSDYECKFGIPKPTLPSVLTKFQLNVLQGHLLGDACITGGGKNNRNYLFEFSQKTDSEEWVKIIQKILLPFSKDLKYYCHDRLEHDSSGKIINKKYLSKLICKNEVNGDDCFLYSVRLRTCSHPIFTDLRKKWYPNGVKKIPRNLQLNWQSLATWFCDDGTNNTKKNYIAFCTDGFHKEDVYFLNSLMKDTFGINGKVYKRAKSKEYYRIEVRGKDREMIFKNIKEYIPKCFLYKLDI